MKSYKYRYTVIAFIIAAVYCTLLFILHYLISSGTPGQLLREFPAAAILVLLSLPVCTLAGYLLGAEKDQRLAHRLTLERQQEQSKATEKMAAALTINEEMRYMAGIAIQEMKHPLTSIVGYTLTLREYWDKLDDNSKRDFIDYIKVSSSSLEGIANDLMRIMELARYSPRPQDTELNLEEIMNEVCSILDEIYKEKGLKITLRFLEKIPLIRFDPSHFFDLVYNLLDICMRCSEKNEMISAWCSFKAPRVSLHLRCLKSTITAAKIDQIKEWPPSDKEGELATLSMEYRLARGMVEEADGELKMESVGISGISFLLSFPLE